MTPEEVARDAAGFVAGLVAEPCAVCGAMVNEAFRAIDGALLCGPCMARWWESAEGRAWDDASSLNAAARRDAEAHARL